MSESLLCVCLFSGASKTSLYDSGARPASSLSKSDQQGFAAWKGGVDEGKVVLSCSLFIGRVTQHVITSSKVEAAFFSPRKADRGFKMKARAKLCGSGGLRECFARLVMGGDSITARWVGCTISVD